MNPSMAVVDSAAPSDPTFTAVPLEVNSSSTEAPSGAVEVLNVSESSANAADADGITAPAAAAAPPQELVVSVAAVETLPSSLMTTTSANSVNELDEASDKNEVSYCFNLRSELGFEVAGTPLAVVSVATSGQAHNFGVDVGWRVTKLGDEATSSVEAFHSAVDKATIAAETAAAPAAEGDIDGSTSSSLAVVFVRDERVGNTSVITKRQFRNSVRMQALSRDF